MHGFFSNPENLKVIENCCFECGYKMNGKVIYNIVNLNIYVIDYISFLIMEVPLSS